MQCYGPEATRFTAGLLPPGSTAYVLADREPRDRYGRYLLYVWTASGAFVEEEIIRTGHGRAVLYQPNRPVHHPAPRHPGRSPGRGPRAMVGLLQRTTHAASAATPRKCAAPVPESQLPLPLPLALPWPSTARTAVSASATAAASGRDRWLFRASSRSAMASSTATGRCPTLHTHTEPLASSPGGMRESCSAARISRA